MSELPIEEDMRANYQSSIVYDGMLWMLIDAERKIILAADSLQELVNKRAKD